MCISKISRVKACSFWNIDFFSLKMQNKTKVPDLIVAIQFYTRIPSQCNQEKILTLIDFNVSLGIFVFLPAVRKSTMTPQ